MKISDEVYVHGYIDEIRNGTIIIRNEGGYFGTAPEEVMPSAQPYTEEEIQKMQELEQAQFDTMYELGKQAAEPQWIPCSQPPETDENVFIARGNENFMSCCIGHYDLDAEIWYEDRNWFAQILYDALYWCKMPTLPEPLRGEEP